MADIPKQEIKLFYCYAREDKPLRDELEKYLSWLKRRDQLTNWHDREILPGEEWEQAIDKHLNTAHLILLLISPDFMASDYCYGKEMQRALARHKDGTCHVIPILLRPTFWEEAPFSSLQLLPTDARPITLWPNRDLAFQDVVTEISRTIKSFLVSPMTKDKKLAKIDTLNPLKNEPDYATKIEADILRVVHNLETKGQPPTIRDLSRYLTRIDIDRLKMSVTDLVHGGQLSENKSGKSPRYTTIYES